MSEDGNSSSSTLCQELSACCRSDSVSEDGLRAIIERHEVAPNNSTINNYAFFHEACRNERLTEGIIRCLLEYFPNAIRGIEEYCQYGYLPLHTAINNEHVTLGVVQLLIDAFPDSLLHQCNDGWMPLHLFCLNKFVDEEVTEESIKMIVDKCPESVRHSASIGLPIHFAAGYRSLEICRLLLEVYPESERIASDYGQLPFHWACENNTVETLKYLYELYPESINVAGGHNSPIYNTIFGLPYRRSGNPTTGMEVLQFLLERNPDALGSTGETPLHIACKHGAWFHWARVHHTEKHIIVDAVRLLIDAFPDSLRREDDEGRLPLHLLCLNGDSDAEVMVEVLKIFLERCPEAVRHTTRVEPFHNLSLPIHIAAAKQSLEFCRLLIEAYPGSEQMTMGNEWLPFHAACMENNVATVKYLYQLHPESINVADDFGRYPIQYAIFGSRYRDINRRNSPETAFEIVQFLLDCDPNVLLQKCRGRLPFTGVCKSKYYADTAETAVRSAALKILRIMYDVYPEAMEIEENVVLSNLNGLCTEIQTFIIEQFNHVGQARDCVRMTTPDGNGQLRLHRALRDNATITLGSIKLLVNGNLSAVRCPDNTGILPLHVACQHHESASVVEYLIGLYSFALETKDRHKNSALHYACRGANHAIIALLLEQYGAAYVSARNMSNQLPIDLLFESEAVGNREGIEYTESIYRLLRAYPETVMK
jgi:ankyrin repeat protein